jgi:coproporphyrinogen III oxidase
MAPRYRLARTDETRLNMDQPSKATLVSAYLEELHSRITSTLEVYEGDAGRRFGVDRWSKPEGSALGGRGATAILEDGTVFERAGVGFSHVTGQKLPPSASAARPELAGRSFEALGVSLVLHPRNPFAPTVHMNVRFFMARKADEEDIWWFGGGMDLTPYYGFTEDAVHFHQTCKDALDPFGRHCYPAFKQRCDEYFYLKHRDEARGIGGIFFDDLNLSGFDETFALQRSVGDAFLPAYLPILERRYTMRYEAKQREWQQLRRGRYVEFNLVYDRGTLFGLQSGGRTESILISMPPSVSWRYAADPAEGSAEAALLRDFLVPRAWL